MLTRRRFVISSTAAAAAGAFGRFPAFAQQQPPAPVTPLSRDLRRNTGVWTARGGTIGWLINPAGVVVVDSQFPDTAPLCLDELLKKSARTEIATLINTHHHGDHTGGNAVFRPKTRQIVAHANVPKYLKSGYDAQMAKRAQMTPPPTGPAPAEPVVPDRTLSDTLALQHGDERIAIRHYGPAHTGGDVVVHFERANVAHMGDLMFNRMHPFIDRTNGASIANWSTVLKKVAADLPADTVYIFGHAGPNFEITGSRADLERHAAYLMALLEYVREQVKAGKTREPIVGSTEVLKGFEDYGPLIARTLAPAYDEVTNAPR